MKNYSIEQRAVFDKPYISVNVANLNLLDTLRQYLVKLEEVKNVNVSQGKRLHLTIYGQPYVDISEVFNQVKKSLDAFDDSESLQNSKGLAKEMSQSQMEQQNVKFNPPTPQYVEIPKDCPTVFISHAWNGEDHKQWILRLANDLIKRFGINVLCDFYNQGGVNLATFMTHGLQNSNRVLIIGTPKYKEKSERLDSNGVSFENMVISSIMYYNMDSSKFIPILKEGSFDTSFNTIMSIHTGYDLSTANNYDSNIETLARDIWNEPEIQKPKRGAKPIFCISKAIETKKDEDSDWKKFVLYERLEPSELEYLYHKCWDMLVKNNITDPVKLAHLVSVFAELHTRGISLTDDNICILKQNIDRLLSSTGSKDALYNCCVLYAQTLSANHYNEDESELPKELRSYFYEREKELWNLFNYRLVNELENLNNSNVSILKQIHQMAPDHGTSYSSLPLFKYVDVNRMVASILRLSSAGRSVLADFLIDRYFLNYSVANVQDELKEDFDGLKMLQDILFKAIEHFTPIQKLSYCKLANTLTSALKRCEGVRGRLIQY